MDFSLTREQEMLKKLAAEFAEKELEPAAAEMDREHRFNEENFAKMAKLGFTGLGIPREYGGSGIGLSIVKAIMESMNQEYGVQNFDNGVEFWFTLDRK